MELNREQIVKALECCLAFPFKCKECPLFAKNDDAFCRYLLLRETLFRINELTMALTDWQGIAKEYQKQFEEATVATVRELQEKIKKLCSEGVCPATVAKAIDKVAKEMLQ